ncbi:CoA transferase [Cryobacterium sp. BB736]|uniref:CoA transferase n=1 Tax=Cryobacterium sp. BB736 TaxID=2746963 RepID=UPI00187389D6|nr:CoA transferase [Cryobacterium sp. BB736]
MGDPVVDGFWSALGGGHDLVERRQPTTGRGSLRSAFPVTELAVASIGAAGLAASELVSATAGAAPTVTVDRALASGWFGMTLTPVGWQVPSPWDPIAGDYRASDGWIRLHTNAPRHKAVALEVLGVADDREAVARAVAQWPAQELEDEVVEAGGCAAVMRSTIEWRRHPQGMAVAEEPLVAWRDGLAGRPGGGWQPTAGRPLAGLRVLDLTRVIAGPVATRLLAGLGASVLRIDPPDWNEPAIVPELTIGKRTARLDAHEFAGLEQLRALVAEADVVVQGYRPGALDGFELGARARSELRPGLVDVSLDAYGWTGPWSHRRGFDSLVQMSAGIAERGMRWAGADKPVPLPVQALDHATGYLVAAAVLRGLTMAVTEGRGSIAQLSLARTALVLTSAGEGDDAAEATLDALPTRDEATQWGPAKRLLPPLTIEGAPLAWGLHARDLGSDAATW